jgi:hypothetical protein
MMDFIIIPDDIYVDALRNGYHAFIVFFSFLILYCFSIRFESVDKKLLFTFFCIYCSSILIRDVVEHYYEICIS